MANKPIQPRLHETTHAYLNDLAKTGTYGANPSDVARGLIEEGIRKAIADGIIVARTAE
jgi:hypothetical protein